MTTARGAGQAAPAMNDPLESSHSAPTPSRGDSRRLRRARHFSTRPRAQSLPSAGEAEPLWPWQGEEAATPDPVHESMCELKLHPVMGPSEADGADDRLADFAHEMGNLVTAVMLEAEMAGIEPGLPPASRQALDHIQHGCLQMTRLIRRFRGGTVWDPSSGAGREDMERSLERLRALLPPHIHLRVRIDPELVRLPLDACAMDQLLNNLCSNAVRAMRDGGALEVACRGVRHPLGRGICLSVADTGSGMDAQTLARIFERGYSLRASTGAHHGIGLDLVRRITAGHQGAIRVRTAPGQGARFELFFPPRPAGGIA